MLARLELEMQGPPGYSLGQKEKDYLQHWVLSFLSRSGFSGVFKGGTGLQKAFGLPRYSEDLDFTLGPTNPPDPDALLAFLFSAGFGNASAAKKETDSSVILKIRARGPLYSGSQVSETSVRLDLSKRETVEKNAIMTIINSPYADLLPYQVPVMDKNEIAAEKIRAIMTRESARDLYDLAFLFRGGAVFEKALVEKKFRYYGIAFDGVAFEKKITRLRAPWKTEITLLSASYVEYETAAKTVLEKIKIKKKKSGS